MKNIILVNLKRVFAVLWQHKLLTVFIIAFQILFLFLMIASQALYQYQILGAQGEMLQYLNAIDSEQNALEDNPYAQALGDDPLIIITKLNEIKVFVVHALIIALVIYLIMNGLLWTLSSLIVARKSSSWKEKVRSSVNYFFKYITISAGFFIPLILFVVLFIKNNFFIALSEQSLIFLGTVLLLLVLLTFYFAQIAYVVILHEYFWSLSSFTRTIKKAFSLGIFKSGVVAFVFLINMCILAICASLLIFLLTAESNFYLYLLFVALGILSFIFTRMFYLLCLETLVKNHNP